MSVFQDFPELQTERLRLRKIVLTDVDDMFEYGSDPNVSRYVTWPTHNTKEDTLKFIYFILDKYDKGEVAPWGIELKDSGKLIGTIDFVWLKPVHKTAEIGYVLNPTYWGEGLMTEAAHRVISFGFSEFKLARIQALCFEENVGSARVMEKVGMKYEGLLRKAMFIKEKHWNLKQYAVLDEEYPMERE